MTSQLRHLQTQLTHLMWARRLIRWGDAACTMLSIGAALLITLFVFDRSLSLSYPWSALLLPAWVIGLSILSRRFVWSDFKRRDSMEDAAIFVEQQHGVQNDLIAALEFTRLETQGNQPSMLAKAVIQHASDISQTLDYSKGLTLGNLPTRAIALSTACGALVLIGLFAPASWSVFWNRLAFGSVRYPTKTKIDWIAINGQQTFETPSTSRFQIPYGKPLTFEVHCRGKLPSIVKATFVAGSGSTRNEINLIPVRANPDAYRGDLPSFHESCRVVFQAGDAHSNPVELVVVPLPQIDLSWQITLPDYIKLSNPVAEPTLDTMQLSVFEGSRIQLQLRCPNKRLISAQVTSAGNTWELERSNDHWTLPMGTPFDDVRSNLACEVQVRDADNLGLEKPIVCEVRIQPDRPPRITASAVTRHVLPTARPKLDFTASDEFGIARIRSRARVFHEDGRQDEFKSTIAEFSNDDQPMTVIRDQFALPLLSYRLVKGDELRVETIATDWRGETEGQSSTSDVIVFKVTDLAGILQQTSEGDKRAIKLLDEVLKREQSIGSESTPSRLNSSKE